MPMPSHDSSGEEWKTRARCAETDPEAFFPEKGGSNKQAKLVCAGCEVRAECLAYALEAGETYGIWGGTSERQRIRLRRAAGPRRPGPRPRLVDAADVDRLTRRGWTAQAIAEELGTTPRHVVRLRAELRAVA